MGKIFPTVRQIEREFLPLGTSNPPTSTTAASHVLYEEAIQLVLT